MKNITFNNHKKTDKQPGRNDSDFTSTSKIAFLFVGILLILCFLFIGSGLQLQRHMLSASGLSFEQRILLQKVGDKVHFLLKNINAEDISDRVINQLRAEINEGNQRIIRNQKIIEKIILQDTSFTWVPGGSKAARDISQALARTQPLLQKLHSRIDELNGASIALLKSGYNYWKPADVMVVSGGVLLTGMEALNLAIYQTSLEQHKILMGLYAALAVLMLVGLWLIWFLTLRPLGEVLKKKYSEIREKNNDLRLQTMRDNLTGLPNRAAFNQKASQLENDAAIFSQMALILADVDNFKAINDSFGHQVGDAVLISFAERLQTNLQPGETAYRLGGDEFALLIEQNADKKSLQRRLEGLTACLNNQMDCVDRGLTVDSSLGVAWGEKCGVSRHEIFSAADIALYHVKQNGRDNYAFYDDVSDQDISHLVQLDQELHQAVANQEFIVHYQPIVNVSTHQTERFEALLRWHHPRRGILLPKDWLLAAERLAILATINTQVFDIVRRDLVCWSKLKLNPIPVNVNVVEALIVNGLVFKKIKEILDEPGLDSSLIAIEITESIVLDRSFSLISEQLLLMQSAGIHISLDDFGTGFANLSHLYSIPFDTIKLDMEFISKVQDDQNINSIIQAVITLAAKLDKTVVCEGVDSPEILQMLINMGAAYSQGFLHAEAMAFEQACEYLGAEMNAPLMVAGCGV